MNPNTKLAALLAAERRADALLAAIEARHLIRPGRTETDVDHDIYALAEQSFGVKKHWHKRIVRAGPNTIRVFAENPLVRMIEANDTVFLDLGPVFDEWEPASTPTSSALIAVRMMASRAAPRLV